MPHEDKTFSGFLVLDLRTWWRHVHTLYWKMKVSMKLLWYLAFHFSQHVSMFQTSFSAIMNI